MKMTDSPCRARIAGTFAGEALHSVAALTDDLALGRVLANLADLLAGACDPTGPGTSTGGDMLQIGHITAQIVELATRATRRIDSPATHAGESGDSATEVPHVLH